MNTFGKWALALHGAIALIGYSIAFTTLAKAHDHNTHPQLAGWAEEQRLTREAGQRFACPAFDLKNASCFCCHGSEIVKSKFRVALDDSDAWDWFNLNTNQWERIPDDIIHWDEPTPTGEAVLFKLGSNLRCFFPPQDGGG